MTETQQTMTEFTYATGETDVIGDRFGPSVVLFWLKTSVAASNMRVMYKSPNTLLGVIPLGSSTQAIPLRNIASVDTNTKFNLGSFAWGAVFLVAVLSFFRVSDLPEGLPDWVRAEESVKRRAAAVREAAVLLEAEGVAVDYTYLPEETE